MGTTGAEIMSLKEEPKMGRSSGIAMTHSPSLSVDPLG